METWTVFLTMEAKNCVLSVQLGRKRKIHTEELFYYELSFNLAYNVHIKRKTRSETLPLLEPQNEQQATLLLMIHYCMFPTDSTLPRNNSTTTDLCLAATKLLINNILF